MEYDIVIIGGGPAGASFARLLPNHFKVLIIEKRSKTTTTGKVCGGLLAPDAQNEMKKQGIILPEEILVEPNLNYVLAYDTDQNMKRYYARHYVNINRSKFDDYLISLLDQNVDISYESTFKSFLEQDGFVSVNYVKYSAIHTIHTKYMVSAEGASSLVRRQLTNGYDSIKKYICIQEWFHTDLEMSYYLANFSINITDYYSWVIPKNHTIIIGSALPAGSEAKRKFSSLKKEILCVDTNLERPIRKESHFLLRPRKMKDFVLGTNRIFLIGEAAGFVSPSSGEGISYALKSARKLARAFDYSYSIISTKYRKMVRMMAIYLLMKNVKSFIIYTPFLRRMIMKIGITSVSPSKIKK